MPGPEMDLKRELIEAGNRLLRPPDEVDELLALLDRVEQCLSYVEQQPAVGIQDALCPTFKALITNQLLKHPDSDVRVGVTACLTEISRITAPDVPYNDDVMKDVFKLTISSFEGLEDNSSKSFSKRVSILEIVARVRLCAVLLDLECNDLVVEMFQIFYKCIRDFHTANMFASVESIMTLIIEESEEISTDLLLALLSVLRKENKDALPIARKLGEKVVQNCATVLKPYIVEAIKSLKINLLDYGFLVTLACPINQDHNPPTDNVLSVPLVNGSESAAVVEDVAQEVVEDATMKMLNTSDKPDSTVAVHTADIQDPVQPVQDAPVSDIAINPEPVSSPKSEPKSEKVVKKRGRKPKVAKEMIRQTESSKLPQPDSNIESSEVNIHTELGKAPPEDSSVEHNIVENKYESSNKRLSPKATVNNGVTLGSPSQSDSVPVKSSSKRIKKSRKKMSSHGKMPSQQSTQNDALHGRDDIETRPVCWEKYAPEGVVDAAASELVSLLEVKKERYTEGESEDTPIKHSNVPSGVTDGTPRTKKRGRPRKDASMSAATGANDRVSSQGTSKKRYRHKFTPPVGGKQYGEELVGLRIKVWWPQDKEYYVGIVESFDSVKQKHKILYTDNEREVLNLHKQKWKLVVSSEGSEKSGAACHTNARDISDTQEIKKLKMDSDSVGKMGNTGTLPKRRGRPPKSATALANSDNAAKGSKPEGETNVEESNIDSKTDAGNSVKCIESLSNPLPNLNDLYEDSVEDAPGNEVTQANEDSVVGTGIIDTVAPKEATIGIDINETFTLGCNENPNLDETAAPKSGHSDVNVTDEVKSGPCGGSKAEGLNKEISPSDTAKKPRKRRVRTSSNSSSPAVPESADTSVKRRRRGPSKLGTSDEKSEVLKHLGDSKVDESRGGGRSDKVIMVNSEHSPVEDRNLANINAEPKSSTHSVLDKDVTKSTDSICVGINADVALKQNSSKSTFGELKSGSSTKQKLKLKTSHTEPKLRKRRARKTTSSSSEQVKKDGSEKRPRGRPCKSKPEDPESDSKREVRGHPRAVRQHKADDDSASAVKPETLEDSPIMNNVPEDSVQADVVMKDEQDSNVPSETAGLKLGSATENKGDDVSEKCTESEASKENMTTSKEQQSEANTAYEGEEEKSRKKRSKKPKGGEVFLA